MSDEEVAVRCRCAASECPHESRHCQNRVHSYIADNSRDRVIPMLIGIGRICQECAARLPEDRLEFIDQDGHVVS